MSAHSSPLPVPVVAALRPYQVPRASAPVDLHLDGNEGAPPPPALMRTLADVPAALVARYPDAAALRERLARHHGVPPAHVFVGAGADEVLDRVCRAFLCAGRAAVLLTPGFEMTPRYARLAGATVVEVPWPDDRFPLDDVGDAMTPSTAAVFLTSPNNPTGAQVPPGALRALLDSYPGCLFVLDEAYGEYGTNELAELVRGRRNAVLIRTLSKAWGLAGARVGYALGLPTIIEWLQAAGSPYPVSTPSLALAAARFDAGADDVRDAIERVRAERARLAQTLTELGARVVPSQANFVFARIPGGAAGALWVRDAMAGLGVAVRAFPGRAGCDDAVRITCPADSAALERVIRGLGAVLAPQALIADAGLLHEDVAPGAPARERARAVRDLLVRARERGRLRLGVVADGPASETSAQLARLDPELPIDVIVGSDDVPPAPSPPPVALVLARLNVRRAWLISDRAELLAAARAAGVVPLGLLARTPSPAGRDGEAPPDAAADVLVRSGAARVFRSPTRIEELLP